MKATEKLLIFLFSAWIAYVFNFKCLFNNIQDELGFDNWGTLQLFYISIALFFSQTQFPLLQVQKPFTGSWYD